MKSYTVYLLRHGLTKGNLNAQYIGHTDYPLSTFGIEQLKKIKKEHSYPEADAVFVCLSKEHLNPPILCSRKITKL